MAENDWAIVIGINAYEFLPVDDHLKYAVNDAVKMRQFLCEQAKFPQENVLLCCDSAPGVAPQQCPNRTGPRNLLKNAERKFLYSVYMLVASFLALHSSRSVIPLRFFRSITITLVYLYDLNKI